MARLIGALVKVAGWGLACSALFVALPGCSDKTFDDRESVGEVDEALNGIISSRGFLVKKNYAATTDEREREIDSYWYVRRSGAGPNGLVVSGSDFLISNLFLTDLRRNFGFEGNEVTAVYYNRGDLGLGREMHCVDRFAIDGQIACYVTNFAAGDDGSEFTFGLSRDIAFRNQLAQHPVATVAMVFRKYALADREQMTFIVYDQNGKSTNGAPLDRHGLNFEQAFVALNTHNPDPDQFGTPGINLNNHIPTNCQNCHGGTYTASGTQRNVVGSYFLPFDLDQFDYSSQPGLSRDEQQIAFRKLNEMVRKIAIEVGGARTPIADQIDGWYENPTHVTPLRNYFYSDYVPPGWQGSQRDTDIYRNVVRPSCRGCHIASPITFSDSLSFLGFSQRIATDIDDHSMPHALQTQRLFWQSNQPFLLEDYLRACGKVDDAKVIELASPTDVITLDPPLIMAAL